MSPKVYVIEEQGETAADTYEIDIIECDLSTDPAGRTAGKYINCYGDEIYNCVYYQNLLNAIKELDRRLNIMREKFEDGHEISRNILIIRDKDE